MKKYNFIVTKPAGMTLIELLVVISILGCCPLLSFQLFLEIEKIMQTGMHPAGVWAH